ncbi:RNA-directed DNA polymerase [Vibrio sp. Y2-5]|uniref:reverse transcriptase family protein n=1 Tax=Vibrio sp. Y2-5 TaxID=2743977 RepID=UPI001660F306|nr:reverse transcriptase family protein [Vibrio sp. Y2-5]MBD0785834.1 RNA-directed DNA polymerase [Vibrio sp. Y2-5]
MKKINNEFFKGAILKNNEALFDEFKPSISEFRIGGDNFFKISPNTPHHDISERITKIVFSQVEINSSACGFVQGKSYFDFLKPHIHGYYFLRLDIKKFFHSIKISDVSALLEDCFSNEKGKFKYSPYDIALMSVTHKVSSNFSDIKLREKDILPIGLPSSPVISNIIFRRVDILIQKYCENKKITYSRYADDLLFSSLNSNFIHSENFEREISFFLSCLSLRLNHKKRKACENTISLNGYVIKNSKPKKLDFFNIHKEDPVGKISLSNKKLKIIKKIIHHLKKGSSAITIMEELFYLNFNKNRSKFYNYYGFYQKYAEDQLQNKLKGYRSYLLSLVIFHQKNKCVDELCLRTVKKMIKDINKKIV